MDTNLYLIATQYKQAADTLAQLDLDEQTVADTLESLSGELEEKTVNLAMVIRNLESSAEQIKGEAKAMNERAAKISNRAKNISQHLIDNLTLAGIKTISSPYFTVALRKNPAAVDIYDAALVPAEWMRQPEPPPPEPDKKRIKEAMQANITVPGCRLTHQYRVAIQS